MKTILRECRSYVEYFIIPAMAVIMPWWLAIKFFRMMACVPFLYRTYAETCMCGARHIGMVEETDSEWLHACKVGLMIDYADVFLLLVGRKGFSNKHITEALETTLQEQQVIFTPHYGCGMWIFWLLRKYNIQSAIFINLPEDKKSAEAWFGWLRLKVIKKLGTTVVSPDNKSELRALLASGVSLVVLPDQPDKEDLKFYQPATDVGRLNVLAFFFDIAETNDLSVMHIIFSVDVRSGLREFNAASYTNLTAKEYAWHFAQLTAGAIKERSYLWRMMMVAPEVMLPQQSS